MAEPGHLCVLLSHALLQVLEPVQDYPDRQSVLYTVLNLSRGEDPDKALAVRQDVKRSDDPGRRGSETGLGRSHGAAKAHARLCADAHAAHLVRTCHVNQFLSVGRPDRMMRIAVSRRNVSG